MTTFFAAFGLGLSLIVAIGAQNAFVLRQGLRREHVGPIVLTCALSDAALIAAGVAGFGTLTEAMPWFGEAMRWGGAAFLSVYAALALRNAIRGGEALTPDATPAIPLRRALATCLVLTWANPHVYLDTLALMGAVSAGHDDKLAFALGGMTASAMFFVALGYGARLLAPVFRRPLAWRLLDLGIAVVMGAIAVGLVW
ncbi:LysE/ArgO family amino acid transporter [Pseudooceanicola onchidii]|uniref:LysE/ArgO family amino acid transporter n=1 Tax=Pseudooceanicola onchidii TaxID=2562279 RepID=UPI003B82EEA4